MYSQHILVLTINIFLKYFKLTFENGIAIHNITYLLHFECILLIYDQNSAKVCFFSKKSAKVTIYQKQLFED